MKNYLIAIICVILIVSCDRDVAEKSASFPTVVKWDDKEALVDAAEEFITLRFTALNEAMAKFGEWANHLVLGESSLNLFTYGSILLEEEKKRTEDIIQEFVNSPKGAYLSDQDKTFIQRLLDQKTKELEDYLDGPISAAIQVRLDADSNQNAIPSEYKNLSGTYIGQGLLGAFMRAESIKRHLTELTQNDIDKMVATGRKSLEYDDMWLQFAQSKVPELEEPLQSGEVSMLNYEFEFGIEDYVTDRFSLDYDNLEPEMLSNILGIILDAYSHDRTSISWRNNSRRSLILLPSLEIENYLGEDLIQVLNTMFANAIAAEMQASADDN